jgi:hypothetical protein
LKTDKAVSFPTKKIPGKEHRKDAEKKKKKNKSGLKIITDNYFPAQESGRQPGQKQNDNQHSQRRQINRVRRIKRQRIGKIKRNKHEKIKHKLRFSAIY